MPGDPPKTIWTIGHSNHPFEHFRDLLAGERIEVVVDVRSVPFSRFAPQFGREALEPALRDAGYRYLYLGDSLGGRPAHPDHYDAEGHALYGPMSEQPEFRAALKRLLSGAPEHRIALLCSEGLPGECHRRLLVGRSLTQRGTRLRHILPGGSVEEESEVRLTPPADQTMLFDGGPPLWRSTQSVSRRPAPRASSAA